MVVVSPKTLTLQKALPFILVIAGIIGLVCAGILTYDKMQIAQNPLYKPACNLNPVIACGSVMESRQGKALGIPNPWLGLAAFPVLTTIGMAMLAGAKFKKWFWLGLEAGTIFGLGFVHWLFFESVYRISALCPYCIVVWIVCITTFWYVTLNNIEQGFIRLPVGKATAVVDFVRKRHLDILVLWFLIIAVLILKHFWYYYGHYP